MSETIGQRFQRYADKTCALECCGEVGMASTGYSYQTGPPHRVLWFCSQGCLVEQLMEWEYVTDGFSMDWGRHA